MNIFYLSHDIQECAKMHVDKHVVKMILEYAQLLSTAHRVIDGTETIVLSKTGRKVKRWILNDSRDNLLYSATHINHPSAVWARQNDSNYQWLAALLDELSHEYTFRYGKIHKCENDGLTKFLLLNRPFNIKQGEFTQPTPAMPDAVKVPGDSIKSYRNYYINNKTHLASWKGKVNSREIPLWYRSENANLSISQY